MVLVIGNGESRIGYDLNELKDRHVLVGCNAIHRDVKVDHLICCDKRMVTEARKNPQNVNTIIYTREDLPEIPYQGTNRADDPKHWSSGGYALLVATRLSSDIGLLGFDLYSKNDRVNNVYKDTDNYLSREHPAVDHSYCQYQLTKVFEHYPNTNFTIFNQLDWQMPKEWQKSNVKFKSLVDL